MLNASFGVFIRIYATACFLAVCFSLRRRRKGWCLGSSSPFALRPSSHFFLPFFRWLEANRAEREPGQARTFLVRRAAVEAKRRGLTRLPRSVHSLRKKWDHRFPPLGVSRCGFSLACCCNLAASWCLVSLI